MQKQFSFIVITLLILSFIYANDIEAQSSFSINMNLIPTSETLGKGGYSFSSGMYPYNADNSAYGN